LMFFAFFIDITQQAAWLSAQPAGPLASILILPIAIRNHQRARPILRDKLSLGKVGELRRNGLNS
jgi:hypothetical protein